MNRPLAELSQEIQTTMESPEVVAEATKRVAYCRSLGLASDWEGCPKVEHFASLLIAAERILPAGGCIETGVYHGGTAGPLILSATSESFHVSIDPFGLPSQSYWAQDYGNWPVVRQTMSQLAQLAERQQVTFCHYLMDSVAFTRADHLQHPAPFRIVHLDGDHSHETVVTELQYFRRRIRGPALFILDDHDAHFPGVETALQTAGQGMHRVLHREYDFPNYGRAGFSAWLHQTP